MWRRASAYLTPSPSKGEGWGEGDSRIPEIGR
jgi:hypothetical protein